jgi:hypothetical protein
VKKLFAIFFLFIYGFTAVGTTIRMHYCMNELVGTSLFREKDEKCGKCGMDKEGKKDCCKDEQKRIALENEHQKPTIIFSTYNTTPFLSPLPTYIINNVPLYTWGYSRKHPPQLRTNTKLHILYSVYLI